MNREMTLQKIIIHMLCIFSIWSVWIHKKLFSNVLFKYFGLRQYIFSIIIIYSPIFFYESKGNRYSSNDTTDTVLQVLFINWQTLKQITWSQCKGQLILWLILIIQNGEWWCPWCLLNMNRNSCLNLTTHIIFGKHICVDL